MIKGFGRDRSDRAFSISKRMTDSKVKFIIGLAVNTFSVLMVKELPDEEGEAKETDSEK